MLLSSLYPTSKCCTGQLPTLARTPSIDVQAHVLAVTGLQLFQLREDLNFNILFLKSVLKLGHDACITKQFFEKG